MNTAAITDTHQTSPWAWPLLDRQAATIAAAPAPRWLRVDAGSLWVTPKQADAHVQDLWLAADDSLALPAGTEWVVEAWPQARLSLLLDVPAAALSGQPASSVLRTCVQAWSRLRALALQLASWRHRHAA